MNGIPLVLMEFKEPSRSIEAAYEENLTDYRDTIPQLFIPNGFVLLSNGRQARIGASFAPWGFFWDWNLVSNDGTRGVVALETAIRGACEPRALLDLVENFISYVEKPGGMIKAVARCNQYLGVNAAIEKLHIARSSGDRHLGVFWHSQGSGKSLSMVWFTQKVLRQVAGDWTFVMVTDRAELDDQLHGDFVDAGVIPREARVHAESGAQLRELLAASNRYVFTLIHKFRLMPGETRMPVLSDRDNVIVITDEAHRTQYDTLATNMRAALPNASFMGFTGTPLMVGEEATRREFGDYVSVYSYFDAQTDGATVPLFYENRTPELQLVNEDFSDDLMALLEEADLDDDAEGQLARRFGTQYALLTRPERLRAIAKDLVKHFVGRGFDGKAMYIGLDKAMAVMMYDLVKAMWGDHLAELRGRLAAEPGDNLIDLNEIDFDRITAAFSKRQRSAADHLVWLLRGRAAELMRRNPTRQELVERIENLVAEYNAGSINSDEYLRRLRDLTATFTAEEHRGVTEQMTEEELAIFDLLTKPEPVLTEVERLAVKKSARKLLESVREKLVLDWRRKAETVADVRSTIRELLDADLPADPYPPQMFDDKVNAIFNHLVAAYSDDGGSVYDRS